jgi:hypothetical protein
MRTTIDIDDQLLLYAKQKAAEQNCSLKNIVEDALREFFSHPPASDREIKLETFAGDGLKPGIDLDNSRRLNDVMDGL